MKLFSNVFHGMGDLLRGDRTIKRGMEDIFCRRRRISGKKNSSGLALQANSIVCATRSGDDDIRPHRPSEDVLK